MIISLRTVAALKKQSCGLFLAVPQELCSEDPKVKKIPKAISDFGVDNSKYTIISLRTEELYELL